MCSRRDLIAVECLAFHSYQIAAWTHIHNNILTDQYNGFVTLKDFEHPDDGFDWGAETCWSDWSVINYPELICAFCWFIFVSIIENSRSKKQNPQKFLAAMWAALLLRVLEVWDSNICPEKDYLGWESTWFSFPAQRSGNLKLGQDQFLSHYHQIIHHRTNIRHYSRLNPW